MNKGFISLFALSCLLFMESVLLLTMIFCRSNLMQTEMNCNSVKAIYLAESGLNAAVEKLKQADFATATARADFVVQPDIVWRTADDEEIRVYIKGDANSRELIAAGEAGKMCREVYAVLKKGENTGEFIIEKITK